MTSVDDEELPARRRVTRNDVARRAGVSTAVVSYVVNDGPGHVAPATAERVRDAIAALGYQPNANARALKFGSTRLIGLIAPNLTEPFFAELAESIEREAERHGYDLLIATSHSDPQLEQRATLNFVSRQVDALITLTVRSAADFTAQPKHHIPNVLIDQSTARHTGPSVSTDFRTGARFGVEHLIEHGHRDIAILVGQRNTTRGADARQLGWQDALEAAGLPATRIETTNYKRRGGFEATQRLLASDSRPTAIFTSSDLEAVGALLAINYAGLVVPDDIALVSFDGTAETEFTYPRLTTIRQPTEELAAAAVTAALNRTVDGAAAKLITPALIIRESCGCSHPGMGTATESTDGRSGDA